MKRTLERAVLAFFAMTAVVGLLIGVGVANAETPAERCKRETAAYNNAWKNTWAQANPGKSPSDAPKPPVPYKCGGSDGGAPPTLTPTTSSPAPTLSEPAKPSEAPTGSDGPSLNGPTERRDIEHPDTGQPTISERTPSPTRYDSGPMPSQRAGASTTDSTSPYSSSRPSATVDWPTNFGRHEVGFCAIGHNPDGSCRGHSVINGSGDPVNVPSDYVYDPDCHQMPQGRHCENWRYMHDYCSKSPDELPSPGANADFRGPCARHDQCLERGGTNNFCNNQLWTDMGQQCKYTYGSADPRMQYCLTNADVYFVAVTAVQPPFPGKNGSWAN